MKWMRERDLLIAQTMAFVQSVAGKKPGAGNTPAPSAISASDELISSAEPASPQLPDVAALLAGPVAVTEPIRQSTLVRPDLRTDFQSEIRARVANFRAHQERFNRERHEYFSATLARLRASIDQLPPPRDKT